MTIRYFDDIKKVERFIRRRQGTLYTFSKTGNKVTDKIQEKRKNKIDAKLVYSRLIYQCSKGGNHVPKVTVRNRKRNKTTQKIGCPAHFKFLPSTTGKFLELRSFELHHTCLTPKNKDLEMTQKISTPNSSTGSVGSDQGQKEPDVLSSDNEGEEEEEEKEEEKEEEEEEGEEEKEEEGDYVNSTFDPHNHAIHEIDQVDDLSVISHDKNSTITGDLGIDQLLDSTGDQSSNDETSTTSKSSGKRKGYLTKNKKKKTNINAQKNNSKQYQSSKTTIQKSVDKGKIKYYNINPKSSEAELDKSGKTPQIKMPEIKRGRGRPKGVKNKLKCKIGPLEFPKKTKIIQTQMIIDSLVGKKRREKVINKNCKIKSKEVPTSLTALPDCLVDNEAMKMKEVIECFDKSAYKKLMKNLNEKKKENMYMCNYCHKNLDGSVIQCKSCFYWFDYGCVDLDEEFEITDGQLWFCQECINEDTADN